MATLCKYCDQKIIWAEREEDGKRVAINSAPDPTGLLETLPSHPDAPLRVKKNPRAAARFIEHYKVCPHSDYEEKTPAWVREPEGY